MHVDFSKDSKRFLTCGHWNTVFCWDIEKGVLLKQYLTTNQWSYKCSFSPDDKYVAAYGFDWNLQIWDADTAKLVNSTKLKHDKYANIGNNGPLVFSSDGKNVLAIITVSSWNYFNWETNKLISDESLKFSFYDERGVLDLGDSKRKYIKDEQILFDLNEKGIDAVKNDTDKYYEIPNEQKGEENGPPIVSKDKNYVYRFISSHDKSIIKAWNFQLNEYTLISPEIKIGDNPSKDISINNQYILIGNDAGGHTTRIINIKTGEIVKTLDLKEGMLGYNDKASHAKFTPDGKFALICVDETAYLYDVSDLNSNIKSDNNF